MMSPKKKSAPRTQTQTKKPEQASPDGKERAREEEAAKANRESRPPFPYRNYQPVQLTKVADFSIKYWFYVFVESSKVDRLLAPFLQLDSRFPSDRRLLSIMNRAEARIKMGPLELYKSLPRWVIIVQARNWAGIVRAIIEMEELLPEVMRFACHPMLMDSNTALFGCTNFQKAAGIVRIT